YKDAYKGSYKINYKTGSYIKPPKYSIKEKPKYYPPKTPPKSPPKTPPITRTQQRGFTQKRLPKTVPTYYVKIKRKGKIVNLTPRPLTLQDAKDFLAYKVDNTLSRSAWFEPLGKRKNVVRVPKEIRGYYNKV